MESDICSGLKQIFSLFGVVTPDSPLTHKIFFNADVSSNL